MEHKVPVVLFVGYSRFLRIVPLLLAIGGVAALLASPLNRWFSAVGMVLCLSSLGLVNWHQRRSEGSGLRIFPDGRAHWYGRKRELCDGIISSQSWSNSRYAVLCAKSGSKNYRFLICRGLQPGGSFRVLLTWLKLGFPLNDEQEYQE